MIKYTIQEIIDWAPSFSLLDIVIQKEGAFVSFKVTTSNKGSLFVSLQGIAPESSWLGSTFLKDYNTTCKMREMETK